MAGKKEGATIVIKKEEVVEGGHHGGAWKVAYADFVTAMMAFFLLMWLLNATTEQQRRGLADYFSPKVGITQSASGFGLPFGGRTPNSDGSLASDAGAVEVAPNAKPIVALDDDADDPSMNEGPPVPSLGKGAGSGGIPGEGAARMAPGLPTEQTGESAVRPPGETAQAGGQPEKRAPGPTDKDLQADLERRERASFERAAQQIRDAVRMDPALADLARQLMIDVTQEGLRVQLVDEDRQPMFATGSSVLNDRARAVLAKVAPVLMKLPEAISIAGHTDAAPFRGEGRSNWDLSADRANATRRLLVEAGLPEARVRSVSGMADRDPLMPADKLASANRRIAITVLRDTRPAAR